MKAKSRIRMKTGILIAAVLFLCAMAAPEAAFSQPPNDNFANAAILTGVSGQITGTNVEATSEPGEPGYGESSVWYSWTAPESGAFYFDTYGSDFDTVLAVYTGSAIRSLKEIAYSYGDGSGQDTSRVRFETSAETRYYIAVYGWETGNIVLNWRKVIHPANDNFADATVLTGISGQTTGTNVEATEEPGEPYGYGESSVWYSWTAPESGAFYFDTHGSDFDTVLAVYTGSAIGSLEEIAYSDDDGSDNHNSSLLFRAMSGTRYYIAVYSWETGNIVLNWRKGNSPNDDFADAIELSGISGQITGTNVEATSEPGEDGYGENSVWYSWTAPETGAFYFDTEGSSFDTYLVVYTSSSYDTDEGKSNLAFRAISGTRYYISVDGRETGNLVLNWRKANSPANDNFADAAVLNGVSGQITGTNVEAISEPGEDSSGGKSSVWYSWAAPEAGAFYFDTKGSEFDTSLKVYTGSAIDSLRVISNDLFQAQAGTRYYISVSSTQTGNLVLNWRKANSPANDNFAGAIELSGVSGQITGTNVEATSEPGEDVYGENSVWYSWTAPETGAFYFDTEGSEFAMSLTVYTGSAVDILTEISNSAFQAQAGTRYYISVSSTQTGNIVLNWRRANSPANDNFADAIELTGISGQITGTNKEATKEPGEETAGHYESSSVWYSWLAPETGLFYFNTESRYMHLRVYTGSAINSLTRMTENPFQTQAGNRYYISVNGWKTGNLVLNWRKANPPANDNFADAIELTGVSGQITGTNVDATTESGEPYNYGSSVWYSWTAPETGIFYFNTEGSEFAMSLKFYTGSALNSLTWIWMPGGAFQAQAGIRYYIRVNSEQTGNLVLNWRKSNPPANDNFADAIELTGISGQITGTNVEATSEPGEPYGYGYVEKPVWYSWCASEAGAFYFDTHGSSFDTILKVYTGSALGSLTQIAYSDNDGSDKDNSSLAFRAENETCYYIAVDSYSASGDIVLNWRKANPPLNDNFADAIELTGISGQITGTNIEATKESGEENVHYKTSSVWYSWTAPENGAFYFDTHGSGFYTELAVYTGSALGSLTWITDSAFQAQAGTQYHIAVNSTKTGNFVLNWRKANPPANDNFADAAVLTGVSGQITGTNKEATKEPGEDISYYDRESVWYSWCATETGAFYFDIHGSSFHTILKVYTGSALGSLTQIAYNYNYSSDRDNSGLSFRAENGTCYHIAVSGYSSGNIVLNWRKANDNFADAIKLTGTSGQITGTNVDATEEPGEPSSYYDYGYRRSVWYSWCAPETGAFYFDTHGSSFETELAVYTGSAVGSLTQIAYNNNYFSDEVGNSNSLAFRAENGIRYYITLNGKESGDIVLNWRKANPPPNDNFTDATELVGISGQTVGTNIDVTSEPGELDHRGRGYSVWYSWTAPETGAFCFGARGSGLNTILMIYTGSALENLTWIACDYHEGSGKGTSSPAFRAEAGTRYYIAVYGRDWDWDNLKTGDIVLNWRKANSPANDNFADAIELTGMSGRKTLNAGIIEATKEPGEPCHNTDDDCSGCGGHSVWYSWTAPATGYFYFNNGDYLETVFAFYTGSAVDGLTRITDSTFYAQTGVRYYIAVDSTLSCSSEWSWSCTWPFGRDDTVLNDIVLNWDGEQPVIPPGDLSKNGSLGLEDAVLALKTLTGTAGLIGYDYESTGVDVNGDNRIGIHEAIYILREIGK